jgi:hypothetical protein
MKFSVHVCVYREYSEYLMMMMMMVVVGVDDRYVPLYNQRKPK